jgi:hypothetical protein
VLIGLVGAVALSLAVVLAVALPQLRRGERILSPEGERLTAEARDKVARGGRRAASGTADLVAGAVGGITAALKPGTPAPGTSRHAAQRGAHRDDPNPVIGAPDAVSDGVPDGMPEPVPEAAVPEAAVPGPAPEAPEPAAAPSEALVIDLRTPSEQAAEPVGDPEANGGHVEERIAGTTPEAEFGLSKGRHAR